MMRKAIGVIVIMGASLAPLPVLAQQHVIAALGDSLTQGYGLPERDGFVPQLQAWLNEAGADVRLVNAGVSGDTTAGGLARVDWTLTPEVDGMIVALGGNDLLRGLAPDQAHDNLTGILDAAEQADVEVMLVGMQAPGNFGEAYKSDFDAIYPELAESFDTVYQPSFFDGLTEGAAQPDLAALSEFFQPDRIHPNAAGVSRIVAATGPHVLDLIARIEAQ